MGEDALTGRRRIAAFAAVLFRVLALAWALVFLPVAAQASPLAHEVSVYAMADVDDFADGFDSLEPCDLPAQSASLPSDLPSALEATGLSRPYVVHLRAPRARDPPTPAV